MDQTILMTMDAVRVSNALELSHRRATVVDRVGGVPVVGRGRSHHFPALTCDHDQRNAKDDNDRNGERETQLPLFRRASRRGCCFGGPLDLLGRTCFTHGVQR